jgi:hypothetical protein
VCWSGRIPERLKEWANVSLDGFENVAFHGRNPIDREARDDYFDSLYYSGAVAGLVTSAFLEAAIVGRPVLTFTLPEYRIHQEEMIHFRYLMEVEGGLLRMAPDIDSHLRQLAEALALGGERDERNRRFVRAFVRPSGLDVPATPAFVEALVQLAASPATPDPSLARGMWLRPAALALARASRTGPGRWLMNDQRTDAWDEHAEETRKAVAARVQARDEWHRQKARRKTQRYRRELALAVGKKLRSHWRRARHRTAVTINRGLYVAGFKRGSLPGGASKD